MVVIIKGTQWFTVLVKPKKRHAVAKEKKSQTSNSMLDLLKIFSTHALFIINGVELREEIMKA